MTALPGRRADPAEVHQPASPNPGAACGQAQEGSPAPGPGAACGQAQERSPAPGPGAACGQAQEGSPAPGDEVVQRWAEIQQGLSGARADLVPALQRAQAAFGYISPDTVQRIARWLRLTENEVFGVATFYAQFRFHPPGRHRIRVCLGTACHVKGGEQLLDTIQRRLSIHEGQTTADGEYELERVACLGCCALAPVVTLDQDIYGQMSVLKLQGLLGEHDHA